MTPFQEYVAPARARPGWWRLLLGLLMVLGVWIIGMVGVLFVWLAYQVYLTGSLEDGMAAFQTIQQGGDPLAVLTLLASFGGVWLGVLLVLLLLHAQPFPTIFAPPGRHRLGDFLKGVAFGFGFAIPTLVFAIAVYGVPDPALAPGRWVLFILPLIALVFVQATAEELIFRGYMIQQLAARARNPVVWAGIPSLLFGLLHYNSELPAATAVIYILITTLMGLTLTVLVWRSGSLWAATGVHLTVNVMALGVVGADGVISGTQLYLFRKEDLAALLLVDLVVTALMLAVVLSPLGRVFDAPLSEGGNPVIGST